MRLHLPFSVLFLGTALLAQTYVYRRLARPLVRGRAGRWSVLGFFAAMTAVLGLRRALSGTLPPALGRLVSQAGYVWLGLLICLMVATVASDLLLLVRWLVTRRERPAVDALPIDPVRREVIARTVALGTGLVGLSTAGYGTWRAFAPPELTDLTVLMPRLPRSLDGLTMVQITDLHLGTFVDARFLDELVDRVNRLKPDLVAITGDLVDGSVPSLGPAVARLTRLRARFGTFFVTGNHEYYSGDREWAAFLQGQGIEVLRNRRVPIGDAGGRFDLVGVDDWTGGFVRGRPEYDLDAALAGRDPERGAVLLAHQPTNLDVVASHGIDLQLSGHTHGGQIFPATALIGLRWPYTRGLYHRGDTSLYVSRGCGFWGPPMRLGSPPEVVRIALTG